jgi:SAM-dependent methyltransferase
MINSALNLLYRFSKNRSRRNLYPWLHQAIAAHHLVTQNRIVAIGAGGDIDNELKRAGVAAITVDIDPGHKPDILCSVEIMETFADASVDAVFCLEVLEHVRNPRQAAAEIFRILRPGGHLIGSTPFLLGIHDAPADYFRFTRHGLNLLFSQFGEVALRERNGYFQALAVLVTRRFVLGSRKERTIALFLSPLLLGIVFVLELLDRVLPSADGTTGYFFIFRKPDPA